MKKKAPARKAKQTPEAGSASSAIVQLSALPLFDRVAAILDEARSQVVRAVNTQMVRAYWLIGWEIVQELQGGEVRAAYGKQVLRELSQQLGTRYGRGFSVTNLQYFRTFYLTYASRVPDIHHIRGGESECQIQHIRCGVLADLTEAVEQADATRGFSPVLGWSHYRALMRVENRNERLFYEIEAEVAGWDVETLERQIHSFLFARLLKSRDKEGVMSLITAGQQLSRPMDAIKNPYVLDFLELPDSSVMRETDLESAIISNLQAFLLELGKGFAFVARQKRIDFDGEFFFIDLVFYHIILKCYVLIDLKIHKLTHQDVGQMDSYVRMYDDLCLSPGDNPTIGLILCSDKGGAMAKYSVLKESQQLFASRYTLHLPTEEELAAELKREILALGERRTR